MSRGHGKLERRILEVLKESTHLSASWWEPKASRQARLYRAADEDRPPGLTRALLAYAVLGVGGDRLTPAKRSSFNRALRLLRNEGAIVVSKWPGENWAPDTEWISAAKRHTS